MNTIDSHTSELRNLLNEEERKTPGTLKAILPLVSSYGLGFNILSASIKDAPSVQPSEKLVNKIKKLQVLIRLKNSQMKKDIRKQMALRR